MEVDAIIAIYRKICEFLKNNNYKSKILFPFHDSIMFEIYKKELDIIKKIGVYYE